MKDSRGDRTARGGFSFRSHRDIRRPPSRPRGLPILGPGVLPILGPAASQSSTPRHTASHGNRMAPGRFPFRGHRGIRRPPLRGPAASRGEAPRRSPVPRSVLRGAAGSVDVSPLPRSPDFSAVRCQHRRMPAPKRPMPEDSARRTKKPPFRRRRRCCGSERRSMRIFVPPEREGEGPEKKAGTSAQGLRRHAQAARTIKN